MGSVEEKQRTQSPMALPDAQTLEEAGELSILDEQGKKIPFKSLYTGENANGRQLIVFIRHFFCGLCEMYTTELSTLLPQDKLSALTPPVRLTIIGCGELENVADYKKRTQSSFPIYCDPSRALYTKLGMTSSLSLGDYSPSYQKTGLLALIFKSTYTAVTSGTKMIKGGNQSQNGGEWVFENGQLIWCKRMQNTRDHAEVKELKEILKIE